MNEDSVFVLKNYVFVHETWYTRLNLNTIVGGEYEGYYLLLVIENGTGVYVILES